MNDVFCALCGVCFDVYTELYAGRVHPEDASWTSYYQAGMRPFDTETTIMITCFHLVRRVKGLDLTNDKPPRSSWCLSGVGKIDGSLGWEGGLPAPGSDIRNEKQEGRGAEGSYPPSAAPPDDIVPYKSR